MLRRSIKLLVLPNHFDRGVNDYWRVRLINTYLILNLMVFSFFAVFNFSVVNLYANAVVDVIGLLLAVFIMIDYHLNRKVERTSALVVLNLCMVSLAVIIVSPKDFGILMWSIFAPIFAFFLLNRDRGLGATILYYTVLLGYLYSELGHEVSTHQFIEFIAVSVVLVAVIYHYESNRNVVYELIHRASVEDPLTGLYNRRWFNKRFDSEYRRARREMQPFYFFIMDIDHFKRYNDTNGHDRGDDVLQQVAKVLADNMRRSGDEAYRLGGEEFGGIINSETHADAREHVEKIRRDIEELHIEIEPGGAVVTASFGLTITWPDDTILPTQVYRVTDQALYRAKENGRNRVEMENVVPEVRDRTSPYSG